MKQFKYFCAIMALASLVSAFLPAQHNDVRAVAPEWVGRAIFIVDFLLLSTMFYGIQTRKPIFWKLIPALLAMLLLSSVVPALWSLVQLSLPWLPFMFIIAFIFIGSLFFIAWWRKQRSYFA